MPEPATLRPPVAAFLACAGLFVTTCGFGSGGTIEHRGETRAHVAEVFGVPLAAAHDRLARYLAPALRSDPVLGGLTVARFGEEIFPPADQLRLNSADNPALAAYARLSAEARRDDFYLFDLSDGYWQSSEYTRAGAPLRFKSDFLVHLQAAPSGGTAVEVIEYLPRLDLGKAFRFRGRHGPDFYQNVRFVAPTTGDRLRLLTLVRRVLAGGGGDG